MLPRVAQMLADGAIIGWFQGRMEFGPRALGNRSFIADPRRGDMRELLNKKVKLREWFRPLAPSMKEEVSAEIFGRPHHDPFMITVLHVAENSRERFPAVVHVDGTARPQTVSRKTNPRYWQLITEFEKLTGCPMVLNTSFNIQEPIVCRPRMRSRLSRARVSMRWFWKIIWFYDSKQAYPLITQITQIGRLKVRELRSDLFKLFADLLSS